MAAEPGRCTTTNPSHHWFVTKQLCSHRSTGFVGLEFRDGRGGRHGFADTLSNNVRLGAISARVDARLPVFNQQRHDRTWSCGKRGV